MEIVIRRTHKTEVAVDGYLSINNERVCDTAECREKTLPAGEYLISMVKCKQYGRRCVCVGTPDCATCTQLRTEYVNNNTVMPKVCPMLKMGNGVTARPDGSIILGKRICDEPRVPVWGSMIHTKAAYERVFDCVRKNLERGREVKLRVQ